MKTVAILDACVLFPMPLRDTLLRIAEKGLYRLHFSQEILDETTRNLVKKRRMTQEQATKYQECMKQFFPESIVEDYESLIFLMTNDPKDRHVLAAAVKTKADIIVTSNLKDFPKKSLQPLGIKALNPDQFLIDLFSNYEIDIAVDILKQQAEDLKNPPMTLKELIERLSRQVPKFTNRILFYEYSDRLADIAKKVLLIGYKKDDITFYEGTEYSLERNINNLIIKHKDRGEILKETSEGYFGNFSLDDLEKFEQFEQELDNKIKTKL
ncbi:MAG: PIN domain-containing protein [Waterburya sp.]